jgi:hypothetical protein
MHCIALLAARTFAHLRYLARHLERLHRTLCALSGQLTHAADNKAGLCGHGGQVYLWWLVVFLLEG